MVDRIDSVRPDGTAVAHRIGGITKAAVQKCEVPDYPGDLPDYSYYWPDATLSLNTNEIEDRLEQKRGLRDPAAWSKELDSALKTSMRDATYKHLLLEGKPMCQRAGLITQPLLATLLLEALFYIAHQPEVDPKALMTMYLLSGGALDKLSDMLHPFRHVKKGRFSMFHEMQLDRVAVVEGLTRALPIMKKVSGA